MDKFYKIKLTAACVLIAVSSMAAGGLATGGLRIKFEVGPKPIIQTVDKQNPNDPPKMDISSELSNAYNKIADLEQQLSDKKVSVPSKKPDVKKKISATLHGGLKG